MCGPIPAFCQNPDLFFCGLRSFINIVESLACNSKNAKIRFAQLKVWIVRSWTGNYFGPFVTTLGAWIVLLVWETILMYWLVQRSYYAILI
jgi:hypothetical protein